MWLPYRLTQLLPTKTRLRKAWYSSFVFRSQCELKRRWVVTAKQDAQFPFRDQPLSVTVSRIIGNDLFPRHQRGQAVANLRTLLQAESNPYGWEKLFVLNRFVDPRLEREAISLIAEAGHACEVLSFQSEAYQALRYRPELFGGLDYFASPQFLAKDPFTQDRERIWACGEKIRYLMNINGARNHALAVGRARSDWTLVLDGSCFLADRTFAALQRDLEGKPSLPYLIIPMRRQVRDDQLVEADVSPTYKEEPQLAFRSDALESFDEAYPYGVRDKTSLLSRLGVPGPWCAWTPLEWYQDMSGRSPDRYLYKYASASVLRLTSGIANGSLEMPAAQMKRYRSRITAIFATLRAIDQQCGVSDAGDLVSIAGPIDDL